MKGPAKIWLNVMLDTLSKFSGNCLWQYQKSRYPEVTEIRTHHDLLQFHAYSDLVAQHSTIVHLNIFCNVDIKDKIKFFYLALT